MKHPAPIAAVPRETESKLREYLALLMRWNQRINLVAKAEPEVLWQRHILDSAQLAPLLPEGEPMADLGSGAGFPGLVLATLTGREVHLIESDQRKCAFLREAARQLSLDRVTIHALRIEAVPALGTAIVTARALAPLADLLPHAYRLLRPGGIALFPKGRTAEQELTAAAPHWTMQVERFISSTDPHSTIFRLSEIHPVSAQA